MARPEILVGISEGFKLNLNGIIVEFFLLSERRSSGISRCGWMEVKVAKNNGAPWAFISRLFPTSFYVFMFFISIHLPSQNARYFKTKPVFFSPFLG